jgi:drug/metabolite transporter (DMT)-like permease
MEPQFLGETAAIIVSLFWSFCSILFTIAGNRIGVWSLNAIRMLMALGLLATAHIILLGTLVPDANQGQWFYMGLSGIIGLSLGDLGYFGCLVFLGPRKGVLVMSTHPIVSALVGFAVLHEVMGLWAIVGMALCLSGVTWVVLERDEPDEKNADVKGKEGRAECPDPLAKKRRNYGVILGTVGSIAQGIGLVISKYGMLNAASDIDHPLNPLSATLMRIIVAVIFFWVVMLVVTKMPEVLKGFKDRKAMTSMFGGAIFGPFLGVWLSMVAVQLALAGIAATLMSLMPIMIIPIVWILYRQKTNWRGIIGACIAILGVAVIFLMPT